MKEITTTVSIPNFVGGKRRRKKRVRLQNNRPSQLAVALAGYGLSYESIMELAAEGSLLDEVLTQYSKARGHNVSSRRYHRSEM